jgi:hypothetical protein
MQRRIALRGVGLACAWLLGCSSVHTFDHSDGGLDATAPLDAAGYGDVAIDSTSPVGDATLPPDGGDSGTLPEASTVDGSGPVDATADVTADAGTDATTDAQAPADASEDAPSDASGDAPGDAAGDAEEDGGEADGCANYAFCDGFEQGFANWSSEVQSGGTISTDSTHAYRGSYALHAHVDAVVDAGGQAAAFLHRYQTWPTHLFARFFAYQPSPGPLSHANYADVDGLNSPYPGIALSTDPPDGDLSMNSFSTGQDQTWESDSGAMPTDQWVCFELDIDTDSETSILYMNDVEVTDMARGLLGLPQLGNFGVGLTFDVLNVQPAQDAWIDEVIVSGSRIGCTATCCTQ